MRAVKGTGIVRVSGSTVRDRCGSHRMDTGRSNSGVNNRQRATREHSKCIQVTLVRATIARDSNTRVEVMKTPSPCRM